MADKSGHEIHVYPGELQEQPGGKIPLFLKLTYVGFSIFGVLYFVLYYAGDRDSALVRLLNAATNH